MNQIISKGDLFKGELVDEPLNALVVGEDAEGEEIYGCPKCSWRGTVMDCGIVGAEPGAAFCWSCGQEMYI